MKTNYIKLWRFLPYLLISPLGLYGQSAAEEIDDENVVELSPFEVTGDNDVGYQATSTLAGTRLRTDLRDIGSSISIVNEEFLRDTGSQNLEDVLIFTPNTEVGGLGGNHSGSKGSSPIPEQQRDDPSGGLTRVRGLAAADLTRDYFLTNVPFDTFNTDRIEVQRGANSALYGLGSPGGIVNASTIKADFLGNRGRVRFETDQYGTVRYSMRYNQMIGDNVAVRIAGLSEDKGYEQKQAFMEDDRLFLAVTAKLPFGLTARASAEVSERDSSNPDYVPPNDGITPWINLGKPVVAHPSEGGRLFRTTGDFFPGVANNKVMTLSIPGTSSGLSRFYQDPSNPDPTWGGAAFIRAGELPNPWATATPSSTGEWMFLKPFSEGQIIRRTGGYRSDGTKVAEGTSGFWSGGFVSDQIKDRSVFDYRENLYSGGSAQQRGDWEVYNASIEGNYLDNRVGFEFSYNEEDFESMGNNSVQGVQQRTIYIDPNAYLLATADGTPNGPLIPNPTFGRPVVGGTSGGNRIHTTRRSTRLQGYGELRFNDFMDEDSWLTKALGKFTLTGLLDESSMYNETLYSARGDPNDAASLAHNIGGGDLQGFVWPAMRSGQYFALPVANDTNFLNINSLSDLAGVGIGGISHGRARSNMNGRIVATVTGFDKNNDVFNTFDTRVATIFEDANSFPAASHANKRITEIDSEVFIAQHSIWDSTVILTGTWRSDKARSTGIGTSNLPAPRREIRTTLDPTYMAGPQGPHAETANDETTSYSIMVHTPPFLRDRLPFELSVYKSEADNFTPTGGNVTVFNDTVGATAGVTEETGFIIEGLDGKLSARFNWFESAVVNRRFENGAVSGSAGFLVNLAQQLDNPDNVAQGFTVADVQAAMPPQGVIDVSGFVVDWSNPEAATQARNSYDTGTQDFAASGMEVEIAYNPIPAWTLLFTAGQQETVASNTFPEVQRYVREHVLPKWVNSSFAQNYFINDTSSQTLAEAATVTFVENSRNAALQDGNPAKEQSEWRFAFNTSYNFGNSEMIPKFFGDLTVGGGLRWQGETGIGFAVEKNEFGNMAQNVNKPFTAPSLTHVDLFARMSYKLKNDRSFDLQVNIKDATNHDGLIPFVANPDGGLLYRISEGRLISVSATLNF